MPLSVFHAHAYDATNMIFDAVEAVAQKDGDGNTIIGRQALRDACMLHPNFDGITGNLTAMRMVTAPTQDCGKPDPEWRVCANLSEWRDA
jgi:hypothetical protein